MLSTIVSLRLRLILSCLIFGLTSPAVGKPADSHYPKDWTPLMRAANDGDQEQVAALLRGGADPRKRDRKGMTALMLAGAWSTYDLILGGKDEVHAAIIGDLVAAGAPVNDQDREGRTALMYAAMWDHSPIAAALLIRGANARLLDRRGRSALTYAARLGSNDQSLVRPLLRYGAQPSLIDALKMGDLPLARSLVGGTSVRGRGPVGETALMLAAELGDLPIVQTLLERGADVSARDDRGYTPLLFALGGHPVTSANTLLRWTGVTNEAVQLPIVEALLARRARMNTRSKRGDSVLGWAIELKLNRITGLLLERGADPNVLGSHGDPPLTKAIVRGDTDLVLLLLSKGADPNRGDDYYSCPLIAAVSTSNADPTTVEGLLKHGARVNERRHGRTPLMAAAHSGTRVSLRQLLEAGAKVNVMSNDHVTALMLAAGYQKPETIKLLLDAGADINLKDPFGQTALDFAEQRGLVENARLLRAAGAS